MILFKRTEWPEMTHLYKSRSSIVLMIEIFTMIPTDAIYYQSALKKYETTISYLRLRYVLRLVRLISDKMEPRAMTKPVTLIRLVINFLIMVSLTAATITAAAHPYTCLLNMKAFRGNCTDTDSYFLNYYIAVERITGKGFGEIKQHANYDNHYTRIAITIISFLAYFILGYSTSKLVCNIITKDAVSFAFLLNVTTIKNAIMDWKYRNKQTWKNYHESLYNACISYFRVIWMKRKCSQTRTLTEDIIPMIMFREIYLDMSWNALKHSHLFRREDTCFLRKTAEFIQHIFYAPGEIIYRQREPKTSMVYVTNGTIQILSKENGEAPIMLLSSGTCIGESSLVISYPSHWTIVCKTYCELEVLRKRDFMRLSAIYPSIYRNLTKRIWKRHKKAKHLHRVLQAQWKQHKIENADVITVTFLKRTLHQLLKNSNRAEDVPDEWDQSCCFNVAYLDLYAISEESENEVDSIFLRKHFPVIFQDSSIFIDGWRISMAVIAIVSVIFYPIYIYYCSELRRSTHFLIYTVITVLWCVDLYIQLSTAVKTKHSTLSTVSSIAYYRLSKTSFLIDVLSALPFGLFFLVIKGKVTHQTLILFEFHKLLKIYKVKYLFSKIETLNLINTIASRYIKTFMISFLLFYYTSMILYCLVCDDRIGCSTEYLRQLQVHTRLNVTEKKNIVIHLYALASFFIADITYFDFLKVINTFQIVIIIIVQLGYTFVTICMLAFMAIVETLKEKDNHRYKEFINSMESMVKDFKVTVINQKRIDHFLKNNYWLNKGTAVLNPTLFPNNMSPNLFSLYRHVLYGRFLRHIPFFKGLEEKIIIDAASLLSVKNFPAGEVITYAGEVCKEMHVIEFGYCEMKCKDRKIMERGHSFCVVEMCLQIPAFYTVVTVTDCNIISLDYTVYSQIANKHREFGEVVSRTLDECVHATDMDFILEECDHVPEEDFTFEMGKKDISFRHFVYNKGQRMQQKTEFDIEFTGPKLICKYLLLRYTFTAYGRFLLIWEISRCLFAIVTNILASFTKLCSDCDTFYILAALDTTAWVDIYIRHHVCYFNSIGVEASHPMRTAIYYWKHGFLIDLIAALPLDYLVEDKFKMYFRMNRVLQLHRAFSFIKFINDSNTARSTLFEIAKYMPVTLLLINYVSAINMYMTCDLQAEDSSMNLNYTCAASNWKNDYIYDTASGSTRVKTHTSALLLTTTNLALIGFTQISIEHVLELCTVSMMILIGHIFFIWITARMVADNFYRKSNLTNYQEAMKQLLRFVNYRKVDKNIKKEIIHYFEFMWLKTKGKELKSLLNSFNMAIKEDLLFDMFGRTMQQSSIFSAAGKSFFKSLLLEAKYEVYIHRAIIYRVNDIHGYIFFILKGNVEVLGPDYNKLLLLRAGSLFGSLDNCELTRQTLMMVAKGNLELLKLSSTYFHAVLSKYPTIHAGFKKLTSFNVDYLENFNSTEEIIIINQEICRRSHHKENNHHARRTNFRRLAKCHLTLSKVFDETIYLQIWKVFVLITVCYVGFHWNMIFMALGKPGVTGLIISYTMDFIYIIYMYLEFHITYRDEFGTVVRSRMFIAKNYLKRPLGFYVDLVSTLPTEIVCLAMLRYEHVWIVWSRTRVNRTIRVVHVLHMLRASKEKLHVNIIVMRVFYIICWISIILQVLTVILYMFMEADQMTRAGIQKGRKHNLTKLELLAQSYMIIVAASTGTALIGQKVKFTTYSTICIVFITLTFRFLITVFIAETSATLEAINQCKSTYKQFAHGLERYMIIEDISIPLRKRIAQYMNLLWIYHRGVQLPTLLFEAPYYLREAILNAMFGFHIRRHKLLSNFHVDLIRQMAAEMDVLVFFPGNYIVYEGDIDGCMYFIHSGEVEVISEDTLLTETVKKVLTTGDAFGLRQGLFGDVGHPYTYKAKLHYYATTRVCELAKNSDDDYCLKCGLKSLMRSDEVAKPSILNISKTDQWETGCECQRQWALKPRRPSSGSRMNILMKAVAIHALTRLHLMGLIFGSYEINIVISSTRQKQSNYQY
ncbi:hypothetical protein Trydic_g11852 [Trypoxylus dichotomus]